ncbi:hypothetical protein [Natronorubrum halophilum]|uniref:hypothetical protein n=1 Tax=Natronorubrum halophilum TaxID=1702106 RepID=UPI000EF67AF2|nr:hypothetical protein [Natronorubrum halophilum]
MGLAEDRLRNAVVGDESVLVLTSGRLLEDVVRGRAAIGLTDRRLLCVSETGEFVDINTDYVCSIRSRRQRSIQYRPTGGENHLGRLAGGALLLGALAVLSFSLSSADPFQGIVTIALAVVTAAVAVSVESVRKRPGVGRARESIFVGGGTLALFGLAGIGLLATSVYAPLFVLGTIGGVGLGRYAVRHRGTLDEIPLRRHRETLLEIHTADGETVHIVVAADSELEGELSTHLYRDRSESVAPPVIRSPSR